jgi:hypothetical protein
MDQRSPSEQDQLADLARETRAWSVEDEGLPPPRLAASLVGPNASTPREMLGAKPRERTREKPPEKSPPSLPRHLSGGTSLSGHLSGEREPGDLGRVAPDGEADRTAARAVRLGIPPPKTGPGPCVLPGHDHQDAHLYFQPGAGWLYWCAPCDHPFSLAQVRAVVAYADLPHGQGRDREDGPWLNVRLPGRVEVSRWLEYLDYEAGLLRPHPVPIHLPPDLSATAKRVANEIELLLGLRSEERWQDQDEFTFARRLCRARTDLSDSRARAGMSELRTRRVVVPIGRAGRATKYRLGTADDLVQAGMGGAGAGAQGAVAASEHAGDSEAELVARVKREFDAEEIPPENPTVSPRP